MTLYNNRHGRSQGSFCTLGYEMLFFVFASFNESLFFFDQKKSIFYELLNESFLSAVKIKHCRKTEVLILI